ncbi:hypothetical protein F5X68DRAFT_254710 [Plectosphaerella plurivora]|uniref:LysM domain-containing protein n=1 Tax=Plectosphaerella plurivora TaxID=936078 RepID=A0A9P8VDU4_9PEZI|nr:hypothetical protein F5X68DRAFT_254710 [Plectosphaerella plurivora]
MLAPSPISLLLSITSLTDIALGAALARVDARDGPSPGLAFDPNTTTHCSWWVDLSAAATCSTVLSENAITLESFRRWNPSVPATCGTLAAGRSYCVEAMFEPPPTVTTMPTTTAAATTVRPTTTTVSNGISTPLPIQPGMVSNCDKFYFVKSGDTCASIATQNNVAAANIITWNTGAGASCNGLWANTYACVGVIAATTPTVTDPIPSGNGVATPLPTQPGIVGHCNGFHLIKAGDTCATIAARYGITAERFIALNTGAGASCTGLWANTNACIRTITYDAASTTKTACTIDTTAKVWGNDKASALTRIAEWCDGVAPDASGHFNNYQTKTACYAAPSAGNRFQFTIRNNFGVITGIQLTQARCKEILTAAANVCTKGGTGTFQGWWFKAVGDMQLSAGPNVVNCINQILILKFDLTNAGMDGSDAANKFFFEFLITEIVEMVLYGGSKVTTAPFGAFSRGPGFRTVKMPGSTSMENLVRMVIAMDNRGDPPLILCHQCGAPGHLDSDCPNKPHDTGVAKPSGADEKKRRRKKKEKKRREEGERASRLEVSSEELEQAQKQLKKAQKELEDAKKDLKEAARASEEAMKARQRARKKMEELGLRFEKLTARFEEITACFDPDTDIDTKAVKKEYDNKDEADVKPAIIKIENNA